MINWIKQYWALVRNSFVVVLGTPFSLVLILAILGCQGLLASLPFFTFGEQLRLVRDQSLALCLLGGCLACSLGACTLIVEDLRRGAAPVLMSRPVGRLCYVAGRWSGLMGAVLVIMAAAGTACLWITRIVLDESFLDLTGLGLYAGAVFLALGIMAVKHYMFGGCYVWQANIALLACFIAGFLLNILLVPLPSRVLFFAELDSVTLPLAGVDWRTGQGILLVFFILVIYSALVTLFSMLFDAELVLGFSVVVFFFGLFSEHFIRSLLPGGAAATAARALLPNWQIFWISDRLAEGLSVSPGYVLQSGVHAFAYAAVLLLVTAWLFEHRELEG